MNDSFYSEAPESGSNLAALINTMWNVSVLGLPRGLVSTLRYHALRVYARFKIPLGLLAFEDLEHTEITRVVEEYLREKHPATKRLRKDLAYDLLHGQRAQKFRLFIDALLEDEDMLEEYEEVFANMMASQEYTEAIKEELSNLYPDLDLDIDPADELLIGERKEELEDVIDELVS